MATGSYFIKGMFADFRGFAGQIGGALSKGFQGLFSKQSAEDIFDGLKFGLLGALKGAAGGLVEALADAFKLIDFVKQGVKWGEDLFDGMMKSPKLKGILSFFAPAEEKPDPGTRVQDGILRNNFLSGVPLVSGVGPALNETAIPATTTMEPGATPFMPPVPVHHAPKPLIPESFAQRLHDTAKYLSGGSDLKSAGDAFKGFLSPITNAGSEIAGIFGSTTAKGRAAVEAEEPKRTGGAGSTSGFAGLLSRGAWGQRGGLGSLSSMSGEDFSKFPASERMLMLSKGGERRQMESTMSALNPGGHAAAHGSAFHLIRSGDAARHKAALKEQAIRDAGGGTDSQLLGDIARNTGGMLKTWTT